MKTRKPPHPPRPWFDDADEVPLGFEGLANAALRAGTACEQLATGSRAVIALLRQVCSGNDATREPSPEAPKTGSDGVGTIVVSDVDRARARQAMKRVGFIERGTR